MPYNVKNTNNAILLNGGNKTDFIIRFDTLTQNNKNQAYTLKNVSISPSSIHTETLDCDSITINGEKPTLNATHTCSVSVNDRFVGLANINTALGEDDTDMLYKAILQAIQYLRTKDAEKVTRLDDGITQIWYKDQPNDGLKAKNYKYRVIEVDNNFDTIFDCRFDSFDEDERHNRIITNLTFWSDIEYAPYGCFRCFIEAPYMYTDENTTVEQCRVFVDGAPIGTVPNNDMFLCALLKLFSPLHRIKPPTVCLSDEQLAEIMHQRTMYNKIPANINCIINSDK